jgi:branched-subunit amino acid transport protein
MSAVWITVIALGAITVLLKSAGPVLVGGRELPPVVLRVLSLLAPALLAAFVAVSVFDAGDRQLVVDARVVGIAAAAVALLLRAPMILVVFVAALATALTRAFF